MSLQASSTERETFEPGFSLRRWWFHDRPPLFIETPMFKFFLCRGAVDPILWVLLAVVESFVFLPETREWLGKHLFQVIVLGPVLLVWGVAAYLRARNKRRVVYVVDACTPSGPLVVVPVILFMLAPLSLWLLSMIVDFELQALLSASRPSWASQQALELWMVIWPVKIITAYYLFALIGHLYYYNTSAHAVVEALLVRFLLFALLLVSTYLLARALDPEANKGLSPIGDLLQRVYDGAAGCGGLLLGNGLIDGVTYLGPSLRSEREMGFFGQ